MKRPPLWLLVALWFGLACLTAFPADLILINVGNEANDGLGDPTRTAFIKCNTNFLNLNAEHYLFYDALSNLNSRVPGSLTNANAMLNVRMYGAKGDGSHDDTVAIQNTLNAAQASGNAVAIPAGVYIITNTLAITNSNLAIRGVGMQSSIIKKVAGSGPAILAYNPFLRLFNIELTGFQITASPGLMPDGARFQNASECSVENVGIYNCNRGLIEDGVEVFHLVRCTFGQNNVGTYLTRQTSGAFGYANLWAQRSTWYQNTNASILIDCPVADFKLFNSWIEATQKGLWITNRAGNPVEIDQGAIVGSHFQVLTGSGFEGGKMIYAQPGACDYFIFNNFKLDHVKGIGYGSTNLIEYHKPPSGAGATNEGWNELNMMNCSFYNLQTNGCVIWSDSQNVNGSYQNCQIQGNLRMINGGGGTMALDARVNSIKMADTNFTGGSVMSRTAGNDIQLSAFPTNSNLGLFTPQDTGNIYASIGTGSNALNAMTLYKGLSAFNGNMVASGTIMSSNVANGSVNVRIYGAKGDGVNSDSAAIQKALDDAKRSGLAEVVIPTGTYVLTNALHVWSGLSIRGLGWPRLLRTYFLTGNCASNQITGERFMVYLHGGNRFSGMFLDGNSSATIVATNGVGDCPNSLYMDSAGHVNQTQYGDLVISAGACDYGPDGATPLNDPNAAAGAPGTAPIFVFNNRFDNSCGSAIKIEEQGARNAYIEENEINKYNDHAIYFVGWHNLGGTNAPTINLQIARNHINYQGQTRVGGGAIKLRNDTYRTLIAQNLIENTNDAAFVIDAGDEAGGGPMQQILIAGNVCNVSRAISFDADYPSPLYSVAVRNNYFRCSTYLMHGSFGTLQAPAGTITFEGNTVDAADSSIAVLNLFRGDVLSGCNYRFANNTLNGSIAGYRFGRLNSLNISGNYFNNGGPASGSFVMAGIVNNGAVPGAGTWVFQNNHLHNYNTLLFDDSATSTNGGTFALSAANLIFEGNVNEGYPPGQNLIADLRGGSCSNYAGTNVIRHLFNIGDHFESSMAAPPTSIIRSLQPGDFTINQRNRHIVIGGTNDLNAPLTIHTLMQSNAAPALILNNGSPLGPTNPPAASGILFTRNRPNVDPVAATNVEAGIFSGNEQQGTTTFGSLYFMQQNANGFGTNFMMTSAGRFRFGGTNGPSIGYFGADPNGRITNEPVGSLTIRNDSTSEPRISIKTTPPDTSGLGWVGLVNYDPQGNIYISNTVYAAGATISNILTTATAAANVLRMPPLTGTNLPAPASNTSFWIATTNGAGEQCFAALYSDGNKSFLPDRAGRLYSPVLSNAVAYGPFGIGTASPSAYGTTAAIVTAPGGTQLALNSGAASTWQVGGNTGVGGDDTTLGFYNTIYGPANGFAPVLLLKTDGSAKVAGNLTAPQLTTSGAVNAGSVTANSLSSQTGGFDMTITASSGTVNVNNNVKVAGAFIAQNKTGITQTSVITATGTNWTFTITGGLITGLTHSP